MKTVSVAIRSPSPILVVGPTGSGKTHLVKTILSRIDEAFDEKVHEVLYCYGIWQDFFDEIKSSSQVPIEFIQGFGDFPSEKLSDKQHRLVIVDDLMNELSKSKDIVDMFTKKSHHQNLSCIFLLQKLFNPTNEMRTVSANAKYIFLFKNPRDGQAVRTLAQQVFPIKWRMMISAFEDATVHPHSHLMIDLHQKTSNDMRLVGNFLSSNPSNPMCLYQFAG